MPKLNVDRPRKKSGKTKFIANDRGHLLPSIHKSSSPWGNYLGTWRYPRKIDRKTGKWTGFVIDQYEVTFIGITETSIETKGCGYLVRSV